LGAVQAIVIHDHRWIAVAGVSPYSMEHPHLRAASQTIVNFRRVDITMPELGC
jgi:hypothetical protein